MSTAPTSRLPSVPKLATFSTAHLAESVQYLHALYRPQVRGSRRRRPGGEAPRDTVADDSELVRSDAFERAYAVRWLTALIAHLDDHFPPPHRPIDAADADALVQQAASLLATCAGVAAAGRVQRRFTFESPLAGAIHVDLTDLPLDNHDYGSSVGAQTWGGACVLAEMTAQDPDRFGLILRQNPLRVLELGAGTGLVGLTVAKLLQALLSQGQVQSPDSESARPHASVVLTDYYPAVLANLESNISANIPLGATMIHVASHSLDWSSPNLNPIPTVFSPPFDVVLGADIVYEAQHAVWICDCLASLLARPVPGGAEPAFHLVIPLRPTHTFESSTVDAVFGTEDCVEMSQPRLTILAKESIVCAAYGSERGRPGDDVGVLSNRMDTMTRRTRNLTPTWM